MAITVAILTVSDRCSHGETQDTSGPALAELIQQLFPSQVIAIACVPDEIEQIRGQLRAWSTQPVPPDLLLTTGGTGLAPRDVTPEATAGILDRRHPGLLELARLRCYAKTPRAFLSRGEAGVLNRSLVINLPGSRRAATEYLQALADILPHAIATMRGDAHDHGRADSGET